MNIFKTFKDLIDKELEVRVGEFLRRTDYLVEIGVHQLVDNVDVVAALGDWGAENVHDANNVVLPVIKFLKTGNNVN
jgi:hypothetical protein